MTEEVYICSTEKGTSLDRQGPMNVLQDSNNIDECLPYDGGGHSADIPLDPGDKDSHEDVNGFAE